MTNEGIVCNKCGSMESSGRFCNNCGNDLVEQQRAAASDPPPVPPSPRFRLESPLPPLSSRGQDRNVPPPSRNQPMDTPPPPVPPVPPRQAYSDPPPVPPRNMDPPPVPPRGQTNDAPPPVPRGMDLPPPPDGRGQGMDMTPPPPPPPPARGPVRDAPPRNQRGDAPPPPPRRMPDEVPPPPPTGWMPDDDQPPPPGRLSVTSGRGPAGPRTHQQGAMPVILVLLLATVIGAAVAYMGLSKDNKNTSTAAAGPTHDVHIFYTLADKNSIDGLGQGTPCKGKDTYSDLATGTAIVLKDDKGATLATGKLPQAQATADVCIWHFVIHNLPELPSYSVQISKRPAANLSLKDLSDRAWTEQISAGGAPAPAPASQAPAAAPQTPAPAAPAGQTTVPAPSPTKKP